uniref:RAG1 n=1 Tax=Panagrolaimus sp. JU765 TaxID=591449 RepID=A0AC34RB56_9BILA
MYEETFSSWHYILKGRCFNVSIFIEKHLGSICQTCGEFSSAQTNQQHFLELLVEQIKNPDSGVHHAYDEIPVCKLNSGTLVDFDYDTPKNSTKTLKRTAQQQDTPQSTVSTPAPSISSDEGVMMV